MLFILWSCSPLPRRGLLVWVRMLVKGRVCRRSPFYVKFLILHPSLFAVVTHSLYFMILLIPPQKCWKTFSIKANQHVCYHFRVSFCFAFPLEWAFAGKQDFGFLQVAFAWCCPILPLLVEKAFAFQQNESRAWLWMLLSAEIFSKCFSMKSGKQRSKLHCYFKGKGYSRIHSKEKKMSPRSQQVSTDSSLHCFHTSSVTLINHFIWGFLVQVICIPYSMRRI